MKHLKFKIISINPLHLLSTSPNNNSKMALSLSNYTSDFFAKPIEFNLMKNDHLIHHPEIISSIDNIAEESPKIATFYASTFVFKNSLLEFKKIKTNLYVIPFHSYIIYFNYIFNNQLQITNRKIITESHTKEC